jgi:hypothetical protein
MDVRREARALSRLSYRSRCPMSHLFPNSFVVRDPALVTDLIRLSIPAWYIKQITINLADKALKISHI